MRRSSVLSLPAQLVFPGSTDQVSDGVQRGEEQGRQCADFVKLQVRVQRDVLVQRALLHLRDQIPAPGDNVIDWLACAVFIPASIADARYKTTQANDILTLQMPETYQSKLFRLFYAKIVVTSAEIIRT
jgi:hypothetical protein